MKFLAVTACPTGVAHTYIAAELIQSACEKAGIECKVETQGVMGVSNHITEQDINTADACILTTDMPIQNKERFEGLPTVEVKVISIIRESDKIVEELIERIRVC